MGSVLRVRRVLPLPRRRRRHRRGGRHRDHPAGRLGARRRGHRRRRRARPGDGAHQDAPLPSLGWRRLADEGARRRRRRARARAGLGAQRSPSVREVLCAPGNAGIAEVARCVPVNGRRGGQAGRARRRRERRPRRRRARGAAGRRAGRSAARSRARGVRLLARGGGDRGLEGVRQGADGAPRGADRGVRRVLAGCPRPSCSSTSSCGDGASAWSSRPTGSPPARAWSSRAAPTRPSASCARCSPATPSATPAGAWWSRSSSIGREASLMALVDGERVTPLAAGRGSQDRSSTATRADDRRHGRGLADAGARAISTSRARCARCSSRRRAGWPPRGGRSAACSTPGSC